jgi:Uma2 family endonuclease
MVQAFSQTMTFDDFLAWYPDGQGRYELLDGLVFEMTPTGDHEEVGAFITRKLNVEIDRQNLVTHGVSLSTVAQASGLPQARRLRDNSREISASEY